MRQLVGGGGRLVADLVPDCVTDWSLQVDGKDDDDGVERFVVVDIGDR